MTAELQNIIHNSTFEVIDGIYTYAKVRNIPEGNKHFMITKDSDEITVITQKEFIGELDLIEKNKDEYALISLNVSVPFYCVGFLAEVSSAIAAKNQNILIVSTYSKDYILVKYAELQQAIDTLQTLGLKGK